MSGGERYERCASERRPAAAAVLALPREFFPFFALFLEKVKKPPLLRVEPNFAPIFPRDVTNMPGPYPLRAQDSFLGPGFDLSREKGKSVRGRGPPGDRSSGQALSPTLAGLSRPGAPRS